MKLWICIFLITSSLSAYESLPESSRAKAIKSARGICERIQKNAETNKDLRLTEAHKRHCLDSTLPQMSALIGALYHMDIDLNGREKRRSLYYKAKLGEIVLHTQLYPDHLTPPDRWDVKNSIFELSGLAYDLNQNKIWGHGDSGTGTYIMRLDTQSNKAERIRVTNSRNVDWEAIVMDSQGRLWILDVGDNQKKRKKISFYVVDPKEIKNRRVAAKRFNLKYKEGPMDCEAAIFHDGKIYLFEKNYYLKNRVYSVDINQKQLELKLEGHLPPTALITDASLGEENRLFLLTYQGILEVEGWKDLTTASTKWVVQEQWGQVEALVAFGKNTFWVGREDGKIFEIENTKTASAVSSL